MVKFENRVALNKVSRFFKTAQLLVFFHGKKSDVFQKKSDSYNIGSFKGDYNFSNLFLKRYEVDTPSFISTKANKSTPSKSNANKTPFCVQNQEDFSPVLIKNKHFEKLLFNILSNPNLVFEKKESRFCSKLVDEKENHFSRIQDKINSDANQGNNTIKNFDFQYSNIKNFKESQNKVFLAEKQSKVLVRQRRPAPLLTDSTQLSNGLQSKALLDEDSKNKRFCVQPYNVLLDNQSYNQRINYFDRISIEKLSLIKGTRFALFYKNFSNRSSCNSNLLKAHEKTNNLMFLKSFFESKIVKNSDKTFSYKANLSFPAKESKNTSILGAFYKNRFIDYNQVKRLVDNSENNKVYYRLRNNLRQPSILCFSQFYHCYKIINILNSLKNVIKTRSKE